MNEIANNIRKNIIESIHEAGSGHPGGSLSIVECLIYLYFKEMRDNDKFVLSKGHAVPALYAVLAEKGVIPHSLLTTLRKKDSILQGHANIKVPGLDFSTGSLGQGISAACGMALAKRYKQEKGRVYCIVGDGECQEGQVWEAIHLAAHYSLSNLCVIVDKNNLQIDGLVEEVMNVNIKEEMLACGCNVVEVDGHDFSSLEYGFKEFNKESNTPTLIIMNTIKGKGVSYMENKAGWHGKAPNDEEYEIAMNDLGGVTND